MPKNNPADVLYELEPPKVAWRRLLSQYPQTRDAQWSLPQKCRPSDVAKTGKWQFIRGVGGWGGESFVEVYRSKVYTNPTLGDAWIEFRLAQQKVREHFEGQAFDHVYLEGIGVDSQSGQPSCLGFATGS